MYQDNARSSDNLLSCFWAVKNFFSSRLYVGTPVFTRFFFLKMRMYDIQLFNPSFFSMYSYFLHHLVMKVCLQQPATTTGKFHWWTQIIRILNWNFYSVLFIVYLTPIDINNSMLYIYFLLALEQPLKTFGTTLPIHNWQKILLLQRWRKRKNTTGHHVL